MAEVLVGIGSNIEPEKNVIKAVSALREQFGVVALSPVFESEAVGFKGANFFNMVASFHFDGELAELAERIRGLELSLGRSPDARKFSSRCVDIDILLFDDLVVDTPVQLPRAEILFNAFVLWPLAELAPEKKHPINGNTYRELWRAFEHQQKLWQVEVDFGHEK
ncbi:2-amino-4-hydroxy-6-hydroxymethyldihydropteridine diphosphokinase [Corallincola platygyrae]|uniref:2-amino-4-hydroxy-6-hydroxymethyldihydropteridine diphosphokinase n=1 Tax=Corallincola platygyrae TaxID=1193278 RepID=A0ABW4XPZ1_9GAMM